MRVSLRVCPFCTRFCSRRGRTRTPRTYTRSQKQYPLRQSPGLGNNTSPYNSNHYQPPSYGLRQHGNCVYEKHAPRGPSVTLSSVSPDTVGTHTMIKGGVGMLRKRTLWTACQLSGATMQSRVPCLWNKMSARRILSGESGSPFREREERVC